MSVGSPWSRPTSADATRGSWRPSATTTLSQTTVVSCIASMESASASAWSPWPVPASASSRSFAAARVGRLAHERQCLLVPPRHPEAASTLEARLPPAGRVRAFADPREGQVGEVGVAHLELAPSERQRRLLREIVAPVDDAQAAERSDRLGALVEARQREPAQHLGLVRVLASRMPHHERVRTRDHLAPEVGGLERPAIALGLPRRLGQPVGVVHPVVVDAAAEQHGDGTAAR